MKNIFVIILVGLSLYLEAQDRWDIGAYTGITRVKITNFGNTLVDPSIGLTGFGFSKDKWIQSHYSFNLSLTYRGEIIDDSGVFFQWKPEIGYSISHADLFPQRDSSYNLMYHDIKRLNYWVYLDYKYLNVNLLNIGFCWKPGKSKVFSIYGSCAFLRSINIRNTNLRYKSNSKIPGEDLIIQDGLRHVLKGKDYSSISYEGGVRFDIGEIFSIVGSFKRINGLSDIVETLPNSYGFIDNLNRRHLQDISIGFTFKVF